MTNLKLKEKAKNLINELPEGADWNDLMYKIYVRQSIEQGLKDAEEGKVKTHQEIKKKFDLRA
ncbi:MAG: hypothetical protein WDZ38_07295 [Balneolaceae bacterium]